MFFCDNDSVFNVIANLKPRDKEMQKYLREFLFWVCKYNFRPVVSKIGTKENDVADFLSCCYDPVDINSFLNRNKLPSLNRIDLDDSIFELQADW